jgi:putative transposase
MSANYFATGTRLTWEGVVYEVLRAFPRDGQVNLENSQTGAATLAELSRLQAAFFAGQLQFLPVPKGQGAHGAAQPATVLDLADFPENQAAVARYRYDVIRPLLALPPQARTRAAIENRMREIQATQSDRAVATPMAPLSRRSIFRWLALFVQHQGDLRALVPGYARCGGTGRSRLPAALDAIIRQVIDQLYKTRETVTVKDLHYEIAARVEEENRLRPATAQLALPSRDAINDRLDALDLREWLEARQGPTAARRALRQSGQKARPSLPYEIVEVDTTRADYIVVDDADDLPLGRPTLTYGLDLATGYPVGFHLGFEPPSYLTTMECLYHIIRKKDEVRQQYGTAHDWPAYGVPAQIVVDNGPEFANQHLEDACLCLGSQVVYAPVRTPEFKAGIERYFGSLNTGLLHTLPGTTFSNPGARGDYESAGLACLSLAELTRALYLFTVDVYAQEAHKDGRGLTFIPARRWAAATATGFLPPLPGSAEDLRLLLGRVATRILQPYGIEFENLRYNCAALGPLRHRLDGKPVKLKYHPGDLSRLYVRDPLATPSEAQYLEVPACDPDGYTQHLSLWKHRVIRRYARAQQAKPDLAALGRAKREIRALIQAAKGRKSQRGRKAMARFEGVPPSLAEHPVPGAGAAPPAPALTAPTDELLSLAEQLAGDPAANANADDGEWGVGWG